MPGLIFFIGRLLFILLFLTSGASHMMNAKAMSAYAKSKGVPESEKAVLYSGAAMIIASVMIFFGFFMDVGALIIVFTLAPINYFMHRFWNEKDPQTRMTEMINFNKNLSIIGAALILFVFTASSYKFGFMLTGGLFNIWG